MHTKGKRRLREGRGEGERKKASAGEKRIACYITLHEINFVRFSKKPDIPIGPLPLDLTHVLCDRLEAENVIVIQQRLDIVRGSYAVAKSARSRK